MSCGTGPALGAAAPVASYERWSPWGAMVGAHRSRIDVAFEIQHGLPREGDAVAAHFAEYLAPTL